MCSELRTAYVGVYGTTPGCVVGQDLPQDVAGLEGHISSYIDDTSWLFRDDAASTGCALVRLHRHRRQYINIFTGANDALWDKIQARGLDSFVGFLASAKWVHLTSLRDVFQFEQIFECVRAAKRINRHLIVSVDPGYDYTKNHWKTLREILRGVDFVFLSRTEWSNLSLNLGLSMRSRMLDLGSELIKVKADPQMLILKSKRRTSLLSLIDGDPCVRTYFHRTLRFTRIRNDTGAGDAFAGGFVAGKLSPYMLSHQPAPIELASIAARERLKTIKWPTELKQKALQFFYGNMRNERLNRRQLFKIRLDILKNPVLYFAAGIVTAVVGNVIWSLMAGR